MQSYLHARASTITRSPPLNWGGRLPCFLFNLHVTPRRCSAHQRALQSVWTEFLFPLSGCRNKLICFQLSCPSSLLQSAHSESCHWARWQQGLISYEHSSDFGSLIGPSGLSDPFSGSVQVEQPQENLSSPFSADFQTHLLIFLLTRGSCANKMCLSLKWPIYGHRLKERLPGLASATHLLRRLLLPLLLVFSVLQPSNSSGSGYLSVAQICGSCHVGQQAFQRQHKDGLSHALNCLFEGNE